MVVGSGGLGLLKWRGGERRMTGREEVVMGGRRGGAGWGGRCWP